MVIEVYSVQPANFWL